MESIFAHPVRLLQVHATAGENIKHILIEVSWEGKILPLAFSEADTRTLLAHLEAALTYLTCFPERRTPVYFVLKKDGPGPCYYAKESLRREGTFQTADLQQAELFTSELALIPGTDRLVLEPRPVVAASLLGQGYAPAQVSVHLTPPLSLLPK